MKSKYFQYLKSRSQKELIKMIYSPVKSNSKCIQISSRNIALKVCYDGANFKGIQMHSNIRSVGDCILNALKLSDLAIDDNIVFCGRTDAGVSAVNMVCNLFVKSKIPEPNRTYKIREDDYNEYPYDLILNAHLPEDIKIMGWGPVPDDFNSRFDCIQRSYRYYFIKKNLNIEWMRRGAVKIGKMTNFYNLCTHSNPRAIYDRKIDCIAIREVGKADAEEIDAGKIEERLYKMSIDMREAGSKEANGKDQERPFNEGHLYDRILDNAEGNYYSAYYLDIKASGFLHNMVRKIFWVIEKNGEGEEVSLEKVEKASPLNLVFNGGIFKNELNFIRNSGEMEIFESQTEFHRIKHEIFKYKKEFYDG